MNGGRCLDMGNTYQCECLDGYVGPTCAKRKDYCLESVCLNGGTCMSMNHSVLCLCKPGFAGERCQIGEM